MLINIGMDGEKKIRSSMMRDGDEVIFLTGIEYRYQ